MTRLKKTTSVRIEDALDIVSSKIIDLDNTAKQLKQIEHSIAKEVTRAEKVKIEVLTGKLEECFERHYKNVKAMNEEFERKNKIWRYAYVLIGIALVAMFVAGGVVWRFYG
ncbi:MAG: hypothetical protein ACK5L5_01660 [Bacteroidales bacterium]